MPRAHAGVVKYHYLDHDTNFSEKIPPVQNTWYDPMRRYDVRLLWCVVYQKNDEAAAKTVEVLWTVDGNLYKVTHALDDDTNYFIYRAWNPSTGGTDGLLASTAEKNAAGATDKRGQDFKVQVRMTDAPGTNQILRCWCVPETLELT